MSSNKINSTVIFFSLKTIVTVWRREKHERFYENFLWSMMRAMRVAMEGGRRSHSELHVKNINYEMSSCWRFAIIPDSRNIFSYIPDPGIIF